MVRSAFTRSNLEQEVAKVLDGLGIAYAEQFPSRFGFNIDFAIFTDNAKIALEVDGPCHDAKRRRRKDGFRTHLLRREGWSVYRVHYSEFESLERLKERIIEFSGSV